MQAECSLRGNGVQVALHTVTSLEAYLHMHAVEKNMRAFQRSVQQAQDLAEVRRCHEVFVGACCAECTLSADGHLATVLSGLLDTCLVVARFTAELMHGLAAPNQSTHDRKTACAVLVERIMSKRAWLRAQNAGTGLKQRVRFLQSRLRFRAGRGLLEAWHSAMAISCCLWD